MPTRRTFDKAEFLPNDNSTPHIVPDVLYPAIGGKLLDGTTSHSGDYGTAQSSDSRKYYYTDIKGSKPIRDPRIGAHFGSQRYKFRSLQLLEQETANHGANVFSIDGREYLRAVSGTSDWVVSNNAQGNYIFSGDLGAGTPTAFIEIVAYGNLLNMSYVWTANTSHSVDRFDVYVDGVLKHDSPASSLATIDPPGNTRYVNVTPFFNLIDEADSVSCEVHTFKMLVAPSHQGYSYAYVSDIELIAQDTTNAVTRNKIQIPSQTVFSFGSKFTVGGSSAARHYDPFSAKTDGTGWTSPTSGTNTPNSSAAWPSNIDTATSLGLANWVDGTNYYRPYNGGRVVNWVDENGEIKTSVNVMPPNAKSIGDSGTLSNGTAKSNGSAPNDNFRPTFEAHTSSVDEDLLSEVAKTYRFREFGNGSANAGTNAGSYKDFSMLSGTAGQNNTYVMDDGLTSLTGYTIEINSNGLGDNLGLKNADAYIYYTFIGTGITLSDYNGDPRTFAQNLPYGTHVVFQDHDGSNVDWFIDGVQLLEGDGGDTGITVRDITYHQPKMPPIPEGACIIADYMLMADFVPQTAAGNDKISKGVRKQSSSRDIFCESTDNNTLSLVQNAAFAEGFNVSTIGGDADSDTSVKLRIPSFGLNYVARGYQTDTRLKLFIDDTDNDSNATRDNTNGYGSYSHLTNNVTLGVNNFGVNFVSGTNGAFSSFEIVTPIHTSHHYKSFETPYLKELIGGDRNMEQTHLICSADGKTWDDITRDKNYLSNVCIVASRDGGDFTSGQSYKYDLFRGQFHVHEGTQKNFAIAYDRFVCLVEGYYKVTTNNYTANADRQIQVMKNSVTDDNSKTIAFGRSDPNDHTIALTGNVHLKRGDYIGVYVSGGTIRGNNVVYTFISIEKLNK